MKYLWFSITYLINNQLFRKFTYMAIESLINIGFRCPRPMPLLVPAGENHHPGNHFVWRRTKIAYLNDMREEAYNTISIQLAQHWTCTLWIKYCVTLEINTVNEHIIIMKNNKAQAMAKEKQNSEYYTQYVDIEKEIQAYAKSILENNRQLWSSLFFHVSYFEQK